MRVYTTYCVCMLEAVLYCRSVYLVLRRSVMSWFDWPVCMAGHIKGLLFVRVSTIVVSVLVHCSTCLELVLKYNKYMHVTDVNFNV